MITNRDIEIAFVRAQNRINEKLENAQAQFMIDDMDRIADVLLPKMKGSNPKPGQNNPLMSNEEI